MRGYDRSGQMRYFMRKSGTADVWDMEDLVNTLSVSRPQICPYFTSNRILAQDADIVFTPFNYILGNIWIPKFFHVKILNQPNICVLFRPSGATIIRDLCKE